MSSVAYAQQLYERIRSPDHVTQVRALLDDNNIFLPLDYIIGQVIPEILAAFLFVSFVYTFSFSFVDHLIPLQKKMQKNQLGKRRKLCYQITNFFANLVLGVTGLYYNSKLFTDTPSPKEAIQLQGGQTFASLQLGYQCWAIPVGILFVREDPLMILHHLAVINAASLMAFFTNGMRYWAPFLFGAVEISSVPLAIMNAFKDDADLVARFPDLYLYIRTIFAITFLYVRVWMFVPRNMLQSYDHFMLWTGSSNWFYFIFNMTVFLASLFLTFLQLKWGFIIAKNCFKVYNRLLQQMLYSASSTTSATLRSNKLKVA